MNKKGLAFLLLCGALSFHAAQAADKLAPVAAGRFDCGKFGPNVTNSAKADLGLIATAMFATPGQANYVGFLEQGPWFLIDSYGSGPLMGCLPTTSQWSTDSAPRTDTYAASGMLRQQIVQVPSRAAGSTPGAATPVPLTFLYLNTDPYRVTHAEQLCFSAGAGYTSLYHLTFAYINNQLRKLTVTQDADCPDYAGAHTYTYGNPLVPNLPTRDDFVDSHGNASATLFDYQVSGGLLQKVSFGAGNSITYAYSGSLLRQMNINSPFSTDVMVISYTPSLQWLSALTPGPNWGLTMTYENEKVVSALQDTGCPGGACPPSTFTYAGAHGKDVKARLNVASGKAACFIATRQEHIAADRATEAKGSVYAKGSGKFIGALSLRHVVPLRERSVGNFYVDPSCQ